MKDTLSMLLELQRIDDALRDLSELRAQLERTRRENAESLATFDAMLADGAARLSEVRSFCEQKASEIKDAEANIARSRSRISSITNARELAALNKEIESARRTNQQRNEELMKLLEQLESAEADQQKKKAERDVLAREMKAVEEDLERRIAEREAGVGELMERREGLLKQMPKPLVGRYKRVAAARGGQAVVVVSEPTCAACFMAIAPQTFIRLQRMETLETCTSCNRFLVYAGEEAEDEARAGLSE